MAKRSRSRVLELAFDESTVDEDGLATVIRIERGDEMIAQFAFTSSRLDEDLLRVIEPARKPDLPIFEFRNHFRTTGQ
jgi:hypothetical protein